MRRAILALVLLAAGAAPAAAHHAQAMFDRGQPVTLNGTIKSFEYLSPHSWLEISVPATAGKATEWALEVESPAILTRAGVKASDFVVGEKVKVTLHPLRDGRPGGSLVTLTRANGTVIDPRKGLGR